MSSAVAVAEIAEQFRSRHRSQIAKAMLVLVAYSSVAKVPKSLNDEGEEVPAGLVHKFTIIFLSQVLDTR